MKLSVENNYPFKPIVFITNYDSSNYILLIGCLFFLLLGCGESIDKAKTSLSSGILPEEKLNMTINSNCLDQYYGKPEELLTKDLVSKYVDFEGADVDITKVSDKIIKDKDFAQVNCKWRINRQRHIVRLKQIFKIELYESKTPIERFYDKYHTQTPEEQEVLKKQYDSLVLKSESVKNKTDKSISEMVSDAIGFDFQYLIIDGIGDAAVWEHKVNDLKVLVGDYQFTVNVDLNEGNDYDLEKAKLIAEAIIEKACN